MQLIISTIAILLLVLIKIGDAVLLSCKAMAKMLLHAYVLLLLEIRVAKAKIINTFSTFSFKTSLFEHKTKEIFVEKRITTVRHVQHHTNTLTNTLLQDIRSIALFITRLFSRITSVRFALPSIPQLPKQKKGQRLIIARNVPTARPITMFPHSFMSKFRYFIAGGLFSLTFVFLPLLFLLFLQELPHPRIISAGQIPQTTKIYDRHGILLHQVFAAQNRTVVPLSDIPKILQQATIAIEDKDFYSHPGFDVTAIIRSAIENASGKDLQGGSTITQQLIKSALLTPETSIFRKIKEVILAFWAERIYTKGQILEMYFNQIPYGGTAWGIEAAAEVYFGKSVRDLDLAESAFLAGIPRAPTIYSPFGATPTIWKKRQREVLARMADLGYITREQEKQAWEEELSFQSQQIPLHAPHFVMYLRDYLVKKYGLPMVERGGLTVTTSLDLQVQEMAEKIVAEEVANNAYLNLTNGATLITSPKNGDILAMVGSKDFHEPKSGNVNVTTSLRQPGSSIKVVTYSAALSQGFTAATILDDSPVSYPSGSGVYAPVNYDGKSHGRVPLRIALANSFNITAVRTLNQIGIPTMVNFGKKMGIKSWGDPEEYGLALTLGSGEVTMLDLATVYGTLANQGIRVDLNPVVQITDSKGNVLEEKIAPKKDLTTSFVQTITGQKVLDPGVTYILASILSDNNARAMEFGANSPLNIPGKTVAVKTGTSDNKRDNWTVGYTPSYLTAVWVGNHDNSPMSQQLASGITGAAPIWNKIMRNLLANTPDEPQPIPENIVQKPCLGRIEYFVKGTENSVNCVYIPTPSVSPSPNP